MTPAARRLDASWCCRARGGRRRARRPESAPPLAPAGGPLIPTTRVTRGPLELSVNATGELRAAKSAMLPAPSVGGTLRILSSRDAGSTVKTGDVMVELDPTEQIYALEQAKSELEQAEQEIVKRKADADGPGRAGQGRAADRPLRRPPRPARRRSRTGT